MTISKPISDRMPALSVEISTLLCRMERPDLAAQMQSLRLLAEHRDRNESRYTFLAADGVRRYSIEMEAAGLIVVLDIDGADQILALHVLKQD